MKANHVITVLLVKTHTLKDGNSETCLYTREFIVPAERPYISVYSVCSVL